MRTVNISLVGVGGQGTLLTSDLLAKTAASAGMDVKKSEIHGMAQRGGSVISQVRFGEKVHSPIVPEGSTDLLVAFERMEALRWHHLLAPKGQALINDLNLIPITVSSGQQPAVENMTERLERQFPHAVLLDALSIARELGNQRCMNMVIAGALSNLTPFKEEQWIETMRKRIPARMLNVNLEAFARGRAVAFNTEMKKA
jgi:indolepyruvate ferredoxin oxidoreductase, beta subunit